MRERTWIGRGLCSPLRLGPMYRQLMQITPPRELPPLLERIRVRERRRVAPLRAEIERTLSS